MPTLDSKIDELYKARPEAFTAARNALAKTLTGPDAGSVKALAKPTLVAWAVNQVFWHERGVYDRVTKRGKAVRAAQLAALKGRDADVRGATESHRQAIADAVKAAARLASEVGGHPDAEALGALFEAVSLREQLSEPHGRLTRSLAPQGFEALAGVPIKAAGRARSLTLVPAPSKPQPVPAASAEVRAEARRREREAAETERQRYAAIQKAEAEIRKAEAAVAEAKKGEAQARAAWDRSRQRLEDAQRALRDARDRTPG